jgi:hypothetical protein
MALTFSMSSSLFSLHTHTNTRSLNLAHKKYLGAFLKKKIAALYYRKMCHKIRLKTNFGFSLAVKFNSVLNVMRFDLLKL